jgi:hypothetical protein
MNGRERRYLVLISTDQWPMSDVPCPKEGEGRITGDPVEQVE